MIYTDNEVIKSGSRHRPASTIKLKVTRIALIENLYIYIYMIYIYILKWQDPAMIFAD